jgi:hypothetical protein
LGPPILCRQASFRSQQFRWAGGNDDLGLYSSRELLGNKLLNRGHNKKRPPEGGLCILEVYLDHAAARRGGLSRSEDLPSIVTNLFARVDVDKDGHGTSPIGFGLLARGAGWLAGF